MLRLDDGVPERAIFVIDKEGIIRYISYHDKLEQPENEILFAQLGLLEPGRYAIMQNREREDNEVLPTGGVVLYCTFPTITNLSDFVTNACCGRANRSPGLRFGWGSRT